MPQEILSDLVGRRVQPQPGSVVWPASAGKFATVHAVWAVDGSLKLLCEGAGGLFEIGAHHVQVASVGRYLQAPRGRAAAKAARHG